MPSDFWFLSPSIFFWLLSPLVYCISSPHLVIFSLSSSSNILLLPHPPPSFLLSPRPASLSALSAMCNTHQQVGLIAARRTGRLTGGKAMGAIADKAKEKKK